MPALVEREGAVLGREQGEHPAEGEPRVGVPMEEDNSFSYSIASFSVMEPRTRREVAHGELYGAWRVHRLFTGDSSSIVKIAFRLRGYDGDIQQPVG